MSVLKPWVEPKGQHRTVVDEHPEPIIVDGEEQWVPERILDERLFRNKYKEYLVQWEGWPAEYATWETHANLDNTEVLATYLLKRGVMQDSRPPRQSKRRRQ